MRPELGDFVQAMEDQLTRNDRRGGWKSSTKAYLMSRIEANLADLRGSDGHPETAVTGEALRRTCADIGNFAMMVSDNFGPKQDLSKCQCEHHGVCEHCFPLKDNPRIQPIPLLTHAAPHLYADELMKLVKAEVAAVTDPPSFPCPECGQTPGLKEGPYCMTCGRIHSS